MTTLEQALAAHPRIRLITTFAGGQFGRRWCVAIDERIRDTLSTREAGQLGPALDGETVTSTRVRDLAAYANADRSIDRSAA